jgi:hypothetical protein
LHWGIWNQTQVHPCAKQVIRAFFAFQIHELNL